VAANGRLPGGRQRGRGGQIEVQGVKILQRRLKRMDDGTVKELKRVYFLSADIVRRNAEPRIPVRSGRLKGSLRTTATTRGGYVRAGSKARVPYAGPIHFGWPNRPNINKEWFGGPIRPNPFLYSALDARREEVIDAFYTGVTRLARKNDPI